VRFIGERERLEPDLQALMAGLEAQTAGERRLHLTVAINYGGRDELARAARRLAEAVRRARSRTRRSAPRRSSASSTPPACPIPT
jgi:undecaprenyl diphosphate synthase